MLADLAMLVDSRGSESIATVSDPRRAGEFRAVPHGFSAGFTRKVHWLRFTLQPPRPNAEGERVLLLEVHPPYLDDLQLFWPDPASAGGYSVHQAGDLQPYVSRELPNRAFVFRLLFHDDQPVTTYLRLQTSSSAVIALKAWEPERFLRSSSLAYMWLGVIFGLFLASMLLNLWGGLWRSEPLTRAYMLHLCTTAGMLAGLNGLPAELWFPDRPVWGHHWTSLGVLLSIGSGMNFHRLALGINGAPRWIGGLHMVVMCLALLALPTPFLGLYTEVIRILMPMLIVVLLISGLWLFRRRRSSSRPLQIAYLFAIFGTLSSTLTLLGVLPGQFWLIYGQQFGNAGAMLALQWMLIERFRRLEAQQAAIRLEADHAQALANQERAEREHQRRFLAMLTHELKTPLSVIRMCMGTPDASAGMRQHAERAIAEINRLIERCVLVSRIEDRQLLAERQRCRLDELIPEVSAQVGGEGRIDMDLQPGAELVSEPLLLRVVLGNLIENGLKYAPCQTRLRVSLTRQQEQGSDGLRVRISNPVGKAGHPDPTRLFDKYYRAPGAHAHAGSGMGLYIVRELTALLGGQVRYLPTPSEVCFELWLPMTITQS